MAAVKSLIKNPGPHGIKPAPFNDDAPKVDLTAVKLSEPPNYKLGDKVFGIKSNFINVSFYSMPLVKSMAMLWLNLGRVVNESLHWMEILKIQLSL